MSDVQFENQGDEYGRPPVQPAGTDLTGKLISWGIAKNRQQASYVLGGVGVLAVVSSLIIIL